MHCRRFLLLFATVAGGFLLCSGRENPPSVRPSRDAARAETEAHQVLALHALDSAVHIASQLDARPKGFLILSAARAVSAKSPKLAHRYFVSAFQTSEQMPVIDEYNTRNSIQVGVIMGLLPLNLDEALNLFSAIDRPQWTVEPSEDFRVPVAKMAVDDLLARHGKTDVDRAIELLNFMGDSGQYPYRAAEDVVHYLHSIKKDWRSEGIFAAAMEYFRNDDQFMDSGDNFTDCILSTAGEVSSNSTLSAIHLVIDRTRSLEDKTTSQGHEPARAYGISSKKGNQLLQRRSSYFAAQLIPLARKLDPAYADSLQKLDREIESIATYPGADQSIAALFALDGPGADLEEFDTRITDNKLLRAIRNTDDDQQALELSKRITDPARRAQALAQIASNVAHRDPALADRLLIRAEALFDDIHDEREKLEAVISMVTALLKMDDRKKAESLISKGYSITTSLLDKEINESVTEEGVLFNPLAVLYRQLADLDAKINVRGALARAESISIPTLRSAILIEIAGAVLKRPRLDSSQW